MAANTKLLAQLSFILKNSTSLRSFKNFWIHILLFDLYHHNGAILGSSHSSSCRFILQRRLCWHDFNIFKTSNPKHLRLAYVFLHQFPFMVKSSCRSYGICRLTFLQRLVEFKHLRRVLETLEFACSSLVLKTCLLPYEKMKIFKKRFFDHCFHNFSHFAWVCNSCNI